jgi:hypothetical protein
MKLTRTQDRGVEILTTSGSIAQRDVQVLSVGVGKLIRDGKNQILLEVSESSMPDELIRELMALDLVARELSGRLIVLASRPELRTKIDNFARPMTLASFAERNAALEFFEKMNAAPLGPIAGAGPVETAPGGAPAEAAPSVPEEQVKQLKEDIRKREIDELGQLRETIVRLENENQALLAQFQTYFRERRIPPDERAYQQRIQDLESRLEELMDELGKEKGK